MPRNVRNFWIEGRVDGKAKSVGFGPIGKDGGFDLSISVRNDGGIERAFFVRGFVNKNGDLRIVAEPSTPGRATHDPSDNSLRLSSVR
jgi:hypothetical protein